MLEFILAENGLVEMFSSMGLFTEGIGLLEIPLSYRRAFRALLLDQSGTKLFKSIYRGKSTHRCQRCVTMAGLTSQPGLRVSKLAAPWLARPATI